jgi:MFS family permease
VPLLHPLPKRTGNTDKRGWLKVAVVRPLVFVTAAFAACTIYLIFAADAARAGGLSDSAGALIYIVLGVSGLIAVLAQKAVAAFGAERMAAVCLGAFGASLGILGSASHNLWAVLGSAIIFGSAFATGSAVVSIWVTQAFPAEPASAFTALFVAGAISSIVAPALVGAWLTFNDLNTVLLIGAALTVVTAASIAVPSRREVAPGA